MQSDLAIHRLHINAGELEFDFPPVQFIVLISSQGKIRVYSSCPLLCIFVAEENDLFILTLSGTINNKVDYIHDTAGSTVVCV